MAEEQKIERTELSALGEFGLIERLKGQISTHQPSTITGIGDDAAVIDAGDDYLVMAQDMLLEGIHFDLSYIPLQHLGYKAVAVNVSDVAAMNARPTQVTVGLGLSNRFSVEAVEALYDGMRAAANDFNLDIVGGDTTSSQTGLVISVSIVGRVAKDKVVYRKGAGKGDIVCATGDLGGAYLGLQVLAREKQVFMANPDMKPELDKYKYIVGRQLRPTARMDIIHELADLGLTPTSMIDISDGLASELLHLANASGLGVQVYEDKVPIDSETYNTAVELKLDPITCALNGGEDYELLFTIKQEDHGKLEKHPDVHFIGFTQEPEKGANLVTKHQNLVPIKAQGFNHLNKQGEA